MRLLALDTATAACSAAVLEDGVVRARHFETMPRGQSEALMPMVVSVMAEAGLAFAGLDGIAVTVGPGAFTGVRIGLAAARAMALAAGVPCLGVTTTEAIAEGIPADERDGATLLVALDAKRADLYAQGFGADGAPLGPPAAVMPAGLADLVPAGGPVVVAGDAAARAAEALEAGGTDVRLSAAPALPDAARVAAIAFRRWPKKAPPPPEPLYLRPPDVTLSAGSGRLRP